MHMKRTIFYVSNSKVNTFHRQTKQTITVGRALRFFSFPRKYVCTSWIEHPRSWHNVATRPFRSNSLRAYFQCGRLSLNSLINLPTARPKHDLKVGLFHAAQQEGPLRKGFWYFQACAVLISWVSLAFLEAGKHAEPSKHTTCTWNFSRFSFYVPGFRHWWKDVCICIPLEELQSQISSKNINEVVWSTTSQLLY